MNCFALSRTRSSGDSEFAFLGDSGFEAAGFLYEVRRLGFEFVVGVRSTRQTMHPGVVTVADCPHGAYVELKNWPHDTLALGRTDRGDRTFHAVSSELMEGDDVVAEGAKRWNEESFFKEGKHQFGLAQFALRTAVGLDRWVLLVFLAWTLAILHRETGMTLEACAVLGLAYGAAAGVLKPAAPDIQQKRGIPRPARLFTPLCKVQLLSSTEGGPACPRAQPEVH